MNSKPFIETLITDPEFESLLVPLTNTEFTQLEENIRKNGCLEPLTTWKGIIIDGHNRYKICHKNHIPFKSLPTAFTSRNEVIVWICANQLSRRNISEEMKKYLIGKKYETKKIISISSHNETAHEIGTEYNISYNTVYKYGVYAKALDSLQAKCPELTKRILSGKIKMSHNKLIALSNLSGAELDNRINRLSKEPDGQISYSDIRREQHWKSVQNMSKQPAITRQSDIPIKQLPKYDPDAEISSLTLTVPAWISSMKRAMNLINFDATTHPAKEKLLFQLEKLQNTIEQIVQLVKEDNL